MNWTYTISDHGNTQLPAPQLRLDHHADGTYSIRADQAVAEALFADQGVTTHIAVANFVWDLPHMDGGGFVRTNLARLVNGWQLSGVFRVDSGAPYDVTYSYQSGGGVALTGSPDYTARVVITGDPGSGCSSNQYAQFNTAAFSGPLPGSTGLESGRHLLHGCGDHRLDLAIQRSIRIFWGKRLQLRADLFNAFNAVVFSARQTQLQLVSPTDQTVTNAQYLADGRINPGRLTPNNAGFGAATAALSARSIQVQVQFKY